MAASCGPKFDSRTGLVKLEGDAIVILVDSHYFHFVYDSLLRIYTLVLHGVIERYPDATILCNGLPTLTNMDFMKALRISFPTTNLLEMSDLTTYTVR